MRITIIIFSLILSLATHSQENLILDENTKKEVITKLGSIMHDKYLYPDKGAQMASHILKLFQKGAYNEYSEVKPFCSKLTSDLRSIDNDKHLWVFYSPEEAYEVKAYHKLVPEAEIKRINDQYYELDRRENFGFKKAEILKGNVGYIDLDYFTFSDTSEMALKGAMNFLSNTDALIIDLRDNGGGQGSPLFLSYFFREGEVIHLGGCICRDSSLNEQTRTLSHIDGKRMPDIPLFILTNIRTFSAAESFAYNLQSAKRGIIVGEKGKTTKGGAHPVDILIVKGDILTQFPICESFNPITKSNWERGGVVPDIETEPNAELKTAHIVALESIIRKSNDKDHQTELIQLIEELKHKVN